jgi:hypothetical protein
MKEEASSPWIKSTAVGCGGYRPRKPSAFPAVDFVELASRRLAAGKVMEDFSTDS